MRPPPSKKASLIGPSQNCKQVQAFLGFCNFYRRFIHRYRDICTDHTFDLTKKNPTFVWELIHTHSLPCPNPLLLLLPLSLPCLTFQTLSTSLLTPAILPLAPSWSNRLHWTVGIQLHTNSLVTTTRRTQLWKSMTKNFSAIIRALDIFRHYLEGRDDTIEVWTDHVKPVYFTTKQKLTRRQGPMGFVPLSFPNLPSYISRDTKQIWCLSRRHRPIKRDPLENEDCVLLDTKFFTIPGPHDQ